METALASTGFVTYTYTGKTPIIFDDHNDEYELEIAQNDEFHVKLLGHSVKIRGHDSQEIFRAKTTDPKYMRLMKTSTPVDFQFIPHPRFPAYPFIPNLTFELIPKLYDFYNQRYFNGACPKRVLFKKSTAHTFLGLAEFNSDVKGKPLYRMSVNMNAVAKDTVLFTDVLLHEMIHLRNYHKGTMEHNNAMVGDGHGRYFKAEMDRLNKLGFHISVTLDWEKRGDASDIMLNIFRVTRPDDPRHIKLFWSENSLTEVFESLIADVRAVEPTVDFKFELIESSDQEARAYPRLTKANKIPANKAKLYYKPMKIDGARVLKTMDVETANQLIAPVKLKVSKKDEPYYALPFVLFTGHMRKAAPRSTDAELRSLWVQFPIQKIVPYATEQLGEIFKGISRGVNEADTKRRLSVIYAMFDERCNPIEYRTTIRQIIEQRKWTALLNYPQLGI